MCCKTKFRFDKKIFLYSLQLNKFKIKTILFAREKIQQWFIGYCASLVSHLPNTWYRDSVGHSFIIDFFIVSADLFSSVVDVCVKRGTKLPTDHHLDVCILRGLNQLRTRKQFIARRAYRMK